MCKIVELDYEFDINGCYIDHFSEHFSARELLATQKGNDLQLQNLAHATPQVVMNLTRLSLVLESIRRFLGDTPVKINSGFRCPALNLAVGGAANSNHLRGCAADLAIAPGDALNKYLFQLKSLGILKEVILHPTYIHISI